MKIFQRFSLWLCLVVIVLTVAVLNTTHQLSNKTHAVVKQAIAQKVTPKPQLSAVAPKFPFKGGEAWNADYTYQFNNKKWGIQFDFSKPQNYNNEIISPANGKISRICTVGQATALELKTPSGDIFDFQTLESSSAVVRDGESREVAIGEYIGIMVQGGEYKNILCDISSFTDHLQFSWSLQSCPRTFEGYTFDCSDKKQCLDLVSDSSIPECNQKKLGYSFASSNKLENGDSYLSRIVSATDSQFEFGSKDDLELNRVPLVLKQANTITDEGWTYNSLKHEVRGPNGVCADVGDLTNRANRWIRVSKCTGELNQKWILDNQNRLWSRSDWQMCIESLNGNTQNSTLNMKPCSDDATQKWNLVSLQK